MRIRYNLDKLDRIIGDLSVLTGISMAFLDTDRKMLCTRGRDDDFCTALQADKDNRIKCSCSDKLILDKCVENKRFESHVCHAGLFDAAMPIIKDGILAGIVLMGRMRFAGGIENAEITADAKLKRLYSEIPEFRDEQIASLRTLLPNVLFESAVFVEFDDQMNEIAEYIKNNLSAELSVGLICKRFHLSKNWLYGAFHQHYSKTVIEYVTDLRLEKAKGLLRETVLPVYEIAEKLGVNNYTYFCKLFKKKIGMSPTEYRKASRI